MVLEVKRVPTQYKVNLEIAIKELEHKVAKVGWIDKSRYKPKNPRKMYKDGKHVGHYLPMIVAEVAYLNEKGKYARPFIRPTIQEQESTWKKIAAYKSKQIIKGESTTSNLFEAIGQKATGDISKKIKQIWNPPLKPSTIAARINRYTNDQDLAESTRKKRKSQLKKFIPSGLYKPLIDTSLMWSSLTFSVENES